MTVEQAEALKAMEPTAAPMASTESLYLKFIGFLPNGKNMIRGGDLALHRLKAVSTNLKAWKCTLNRIPTVKG